MKFQSFLRKFGERVPLSRQDAKRSSSRKAAKAPHLLLESLEERTLLAVAVTPLLPTPTVTNHAVVATTANFDNPNVAADNLSSPTIVYDPLNPQKLVAVYVNDDLEPTHAINPDDNFDSPTQHPYTLRVDAAYSVDGGATWTEIPEQGFNASGANISSGDYLPYNVIDPVKTTITLVAGGTPTYDIWHFQESMEPSVAFDRNNNFFIVYVESSTDNMEGAVMLQKYSFTSSTPSLTDKDHYLYGWAGKDPAINPEVVVDDNLPVYTDPTTGKTQTDPYSGNVYVTWNTDNNAPGITTHAGIFNPNTIVATASSDDGATWSGIEFISQGVGGLQSPNYYGNGNPSSYSYPQIAVSQGTASGSVAGGQVNFVWDNSLGLNQQIIADHFSDGAQDFVTASATNLSLQLNPGTGGTVITPGITTSKLNVSFPSGSLALSDLQVTINALIPDLADYGVYLIAPTGDVVTLLDPKLLPNGTSVTNAGATSVDNLGIINDNIPNAFALPPVDNSSTQGTQLGTVFDDNAAMAINDPKMSAHNVGLVAPEAVNDGSTTLTQLLAKLLNEGGGSASKLDGTWTLEIVDDANNPATGTEPVPTLENWKLSFTSGMEPAASEVVANVSLPSAPNGGLGTSSNPGPVFPTLVAANPNVGIAPAPTIASDNTLGSFSTYQGRLYITYVDYSAVQGGASGHDTNIFLLTSDNGGASWTNQGIVNNDDAATDGYSDSNQNSSVGYTTGRPQFEPQVQVDQTTGTVVVSFYDTRNDAATSRVATYVATSIDGGLNFGPETFLNEPNDPTDAITGQAVNLGPIPDNESAANPAADKVFSFGTHQGLAVVDGRIIAVWSGNEDGGTEPFSPETLQILAGTALIPDGPRILASTEGPVTAESGTILDSGPLGTAGSTVSFNNLTSATGVQELNGFVVTFDRFVDPASFTTGDVEIYYRSPTTAGTSPGTLILATAITPLYDPDYADIDSRYNFATQQKFGAMRFLVSFAPQSGVGTYSYAVGPNINDRVQTALDLVIPAGPSTKTSSATVISADPGGVVDPVYDVTVNVTLAGTLANPLNDADLTLELVAPNGTTITLASDNGGGGVSGASFTGGGAGGFIATTFSDSAALPIAAGSVPFTGAFQPVEPLANLIGIDADGTWSLKIINGAGGTAGLLYAWSAQINLKSGRTVTANPAPGNLMDQNANGIDGQDPAAAPITSKQPGDVYADPQPQPATAVVFSGDDFGPPYNVNTLPLIISGPHVAATMINATFTPHQAQLGVAIPASGTGGSGNPVLDDANSILTISGVDAAATIAHLTVNVTLTSSNDGGLILSLMGPDGTKVILSNSEGGSGKNFTFTTFDDVATTALSSGTAPFSGTFKPDQALAAFIGKELNGNWTLQVDDTLNGDSGSIVTWSMTATVAGDTDNLALNATVSSIDVVFDRNMLPANTTTSGSFTPGQIQQLIGPTGAITGPFTITGNPLGTDPDPTHPRTFQISFPTQEISGSYSLTFGPNIADEQGNLMDTNENAGLDMLRDTDSSGTQSTTYSSTNVGLQIGNATTANAVTTSTLTISDDYLIQGISLTLNVSYPNDPDLSAVLIAPDGVTQIPLFTNVGNNGSSRANFQNTVFTDSASTPIDQGGAPFFGAFNPQFPLSVLDNTSAQGTWTLQITDDVSGRTGTLNSWSLTLLKPVPLTGLGEPVADQASVNFRIFTLDPANPLSSSTWTAVGPAAIGTNGNSGSVTAIAVDPSDPSGNTVFIGAASGGVWKTTDFLTQSPNGPSYVPLTDFGPATSLSISSIAIFPRNNNPQQSIIVAATGDGNTQSPGVGFLLSTDGGATWTLLDSTSNYDTQTGQPLPITGSTPDGQSRNHAFVGLTSFKVIVDPNPTVSGGVIIYAAFGGESTNSGIWRSLDTGKTWTQMLAGDATDIVLDPNSGSINAISNPTGNLLIAYAAIVDQGVYISPNQGQVWNQLLGGVGDPFIRDKNFFGNPAIAVQAPPSTPGVTGTGRILLAKPALTSSPAENLQYEGWVYALSITAAGDFGGLYLTKDFGENWTDITIPTDPEQIVPSDYLPFGTGETAIPTNDSTLPNYNAFQDTRQTIPAQGNYDVSFAVDPLNPNVVYIGGTGDFFLGDAGGLIRVDTTGVSDAHSYYQGTNFNTKGDKGSLQYASQDPIENILTPLNTYAFGPTAYINLIRNPNDIFNSSATITIFGENGFANTGAGAKWIPFADTGILGNSGGQLALVAMKDPVTGQTRLIFGDNQGVFTGVDDNGVYENALGSTDDQTDGSGDINVVHGSRNGNLQITELYYGASQPSNLAAEISQISGLFIGGTQDNGSPSSDANVLTDGNLVWTQNQAASTFSDADSSGVATDQTGSGLVYQYKQPALGGGPTNFFQVNGIGSTFGLLQNGNDTADWPGDPAGALSNSSVNQGAFGNFAVNPIDPQQIVISSKTGTIFGTTNQGLFWLKIGDPTALDGSYAPALAYGAPDPTDPTGALNDFIYAGTVDGHIYVTFTGGGANGNQWINLSAGLDGSSVREIIPDPTRGTHAAYAVTNNGVYFMADSSAANATWKNVSGNLFQVMTNYFTPFESSTQLTGPLALTLDTIQVDWRYSIPNNPTEIDNPVTPPGPTHPVIYVGGTSGVYRSIDGGVTWTQFPDVGDDGAAQNGGYLPNVDVTDLTLAIGNIDPTTGQAVLVNTATGADGPDVLLATTYGRGDFVIKVPPLVLPGEIQLDPNLPAPGGSISGPNKTSTTTNVLQPVFDGMSETSAFGNTVTVRLYDLTNGTDNPPQIGVDPNDSANDFVVTDQNGRFEIQVEPGYFTASGLTDGPKIVGLQATDATGAVGPMETFDWTLNTTPYIHDLPGDPTDVHFDANSPLPTGQGGSDSGISFSDKITNVTQPILDGQVDQAAPTLITLTENGVLIGSGTTTATGSFSIQVLPGIYGPGGRFPDGLQTISIVAPHGGIPSNTVTFQFTEVTVAPPAPGAPNLLAASDSGTSNSDHITNFTQPTFSGTATPGQYGTTLVQLFANGTFVGTDTLNGLGQYDVTVSPGTLADGTYNMTVRLEDVAGNLSGMSPAMTPPLVISTQAPATPTITLDPAYDTGPAGAVPPVTAAAPQLFDGTSNPGTTVQIFDNGTLIDTFAMGTASTFSRSENLSDGDHVLTVIATDLAGNTATFAPTQTDGKHGYEVEIDPTALSKDLLFIRALYFQDLGRQGSLPEWNSWLTLLGETNGRALVANAIDRSPEARDLQVVGLYRTLLGRTPANGEESGWVNRLLAGATLEQVEAAIMSSTEYYNRAPSIVGAASNTPTNATFVEALYKQLLNRTPAASEVSYWANLVPVVGLDAIAGAFLVSAEYRGDVVLGYYNNILQRPTQPTQAEINGWVNSGLDLTTILIDFEGSEEYFLRVIGFES